MKIKEQEFINAMNSVINKEQDKGMERQLMSSENKFNSNENIDKMSELLRNPENQTKQNEA